MVSPFFLIGILMMLIPAILPEKSQFKLFTVSQSIERTIRIKHIMHNFPSLIKEIHTIFRYVNIRKYGAKSHLIWIRQKSKYINKEASKTFKNVAL